MKKTHFKWFIPIICAIILGITGFTNSYYKKMPEVFTTLENLSRSTGNYIPESQYSDIMSNQVEPYLKELGQESILTTPNDYQIYYRSYIVPESKGTIVIAHGFSEWIEKYNELIYYFTTEGYSVYIPSHRGHGLSTRLVDDLSMVHIDDFDDYVTDLAHLMNQVVVPTLEDEPLFLFGHSMGGGISTLFLERYPNIVDAAILSSPMLEVKLPGVPNFLGYLAATTFDLLGKGDEYVFTHGPFEGVPDFESSSTQSEARYMYYFNKRASHDYFHTEGASFSWLQEALSATQTMASDAHLISNPVLLFQAEEDTMVKPGGQNHFMKKAPDAEMVFVPGAKHDLYAEKDSILFPYLDKIFKFLDEQIG